MYIYIHINIYIHLYVYLREFHQVTRVYATTQKRSKYILLSKPVVSEKKVEIQEFYVNEIQKI